MAEKEKVESSVERLRDAIAHARDLHRRYEEAREKRELEALKRAKEQGTKPLP